MSYRDLIDFVVMTVATLTILALGSIADQIIYGSLR